MTLRGLTSVEERTANVVERAREVELEVEPEEVTELLQFHDQILNTQSYFLWTNKENAFLI